MINFEEKSLKAIYRRKLPTRNPRVRYTAVTIVLRQIVIKN